MKLFLIILAVIILLPFLIYFILWIFLVIRPKFKVDKSYFGKERINIQENHYELDDCWLRKNSYGLWELFITGNGFKNGFFYGKLCKELLHIQEKFFIDEIKRIVPSNMHTFFLKIVIGFINRKIQKYIPEEILHEIYGISLSASNKYNYITNNYQRYLNYHAANDIGFAVEGMKMVACSAFAVWDDKSTDGALLAGRNFDFYFGEQFARDKFICFYKPYSGHSFMMVSWAGMIGAVSGMNVNGLAVTINTARSNKPSKARTPLCILGRMILQYASDIEEALEIAKNTQTFVSASILVTSKIDNKAVVIEKNFKKTYVFEQADQNFISCTNHFQSNAFSDDALNVDNMMNSFSVNRLKRLNELINTYSKIGINEISSILRNQKGIGNIEIGMGNEKAINHLSAHHSVIFKPAELKVWISVKKYQLGEFICYDLNKVFSADHSCDKESPLYLNEYTINADDFLFSENLKNYLKYREMENIIEDVTKKKIKLKLNRDDINYFISLNPELYKSYLTAANYHYSIKNYKMALTHYELALTKEIASEKEKKFMQNRILQLKNKI